MLRDLDRDRAFIGQRAIKRAIDEGSSRWKMVGLIVDWEAYDEMYEQAGLVPPKDHHPITEDFMLYDRDYQRVAYATSFMYSPMLQRHIALGRVRPDLAKVGEAVELEVTVNHRYERVAAHVARLPLFNPPRKTS
jgi:aminomethyltransferase